jgi:hypothetical protein
MTAGVCVMRRYFINPRKKNTSSSTRISTIASSMNWPREIVDSSTAFR